ncbi:MAG TPA: nuclear transport factor 2 family protein [Acidobacteriaceae bacterium]|nr:nuclear transport factor 2 family protein [Acidobacteriaceae bacterium]
MENFSLPIQPAFARAFAQEWIEAWNSRDLDRILAHYSDDVVLLSPVALKLLNNGTGMVEGKAALRDYFLRGLNAYPDLRFVLTDVLWGVETIVAYYGNNVRDGKTAEVMQFGSSGKIIRVFANYNS